MDVSFCTDVNPPCRKQQFNDLSSFINSDVLHSWPLLFVSGPPASGKSCVTRHVLHKKKTTYIWVNCSECFSVRILFESILSEIHGVLEGKADEDFRCTNFADFVIKLKSYYSAAPKKVVMVLDSASYLLRLDFTVLAALLRLYELELPIMLLLISCLPWEKFRSAAAGCEPVLVHFPAYTSDEMVEVLSLSVPETAPSTEFFVHYLRLCCSVFSPVCRDLRQLRRQALLHFDNYIQPVTSGEVAAEDSLRLWRRFEAVLRRALHTVYLGEMSSLLWNDHLSSGSENSLPILLSRHHVELPLYSKYLLIAAFLASYNPASSDKRFFVKAGDKNARKKRITKKGDRTSNLVLGPKSFPLDRLMAIFRTIGERDVPVSVAVSAQVSSLVALGLLLQLGLTDRLEAPRYKCLASLDFVQTISKHVRFSLNEYLYDFVVKAS